MRSSRLPARGDQAVIRIDLQVAPAGQFSLVAGALQLRAAQGRGLLHALGDLLLHRKRDVDHWRRHRLQQERAHRVVDWSAAHPLAMFAGVPHDGFVADIIRAQPPLEWLLMDAHACTAAAAQQPSLQQTAALAGHASAQAR